MKLRKGKTKYKLPAYSQVVAAWIEGNQKHNQLHRYVLQIVNLWALERNLEAGRPRVCAIFANTIEFSPPPDKPYVVTVRYLPPFMEC